MSGVGHARDVEPTVDSQVRKWDRRRTRDCDCVYGPVGAKSSRAKRSVRESLTVL